MFICDKPIAIILILDKRKSQWKRIPGYQKTQIANHAEMNNKNDFIQYFDNVTKEMFEYQIGGYKVLAKWLKDRKANILSSDEIQHYCKIVSVIKETIGIIV